MRGFNLDNYGKSRADRDAAWRRLQQEEHGRAFTSLDGGAQAEMLDGMLRGPPPMTDAGALQLSEKRVSQFKTLTKDFKQFTVLLNLALPPYWTSEEII